MHDLCGSQDLDSSFQIKREQVQQRSKVLRCGALVKQVLTRPSGHALDSTTHRQCPPSFDAVKLRLVMKW